MCISTSLYVQILHLTLRAIFIQNQRNKRGREVAEAMIELRER